MPRILIAFLAGVFVSTSLFAADTPKRPNILFIYTDDHSHRTVSCYPESYPWVKTPNIDRLADNGVRFSYAYIGTWCMPSRATLLTGHHPYGVQSMRMAGPYPGSTYDPKQCPFWPSVFRKKGYVTAQIGKWHTGTDTGAGRDWDHQIVWNRPRFPKNAGNYFKDQLIEFNGKKAKLVKGYTTDNYTKWAEEFIRGKHRDPKKPWYCWVCYGAVHAPFTPAKRHLKSYPGIKVPTPKDIYPPRPGKPAYLQKMEHWVKGKNGEPELKEKNLSMKSVKPQPGIHGDTLTAWVRQYHQGVLAIDEGVGKLIKALKDSGQYDNTLIIFTSDQGFGWGQHGFRHKLAPYDATIRSPMIVSMPSRIPSGKVCPTPVGGVDIVPTIFSFAGFKLPWKMHGHDLTPLLKNPNKKWPHPVLTTLMQRKYGGDCDKLPDDPKERNLAGIPWWISLRQGRYKYIRNLVEGEIEELYDLKSDPEELKNLAFSGKHRKTLRTFRKNLLKELRRTGAKIVDNLPAVREVPVEKRRQANTASVRRQPADSSTQSAAAQPPVLTFGPKKKSELNASASHAALAQLKTWLKAPAKDRKPIGEQAFAKTALTRQDSDSARQLLWRDYAATAKKARAAEMKAKVITRGNLKMPFHYQIFGKKPKNGRSLFISMHGGGGAPKRVNDQQWENQKRLYRPKEGVYLCPRAPTNTWNLWHQGHIDPMFERIIQNMVIFEGVDPNRVYIMGYSAGGDGVYQVAPRFADRLAAAAMMAGHPNETSPLGLRNIGFTLHMGGKDSAYNRNKVARAWKKKLADLQKGDPKGYRHHVKIHEQFGHWMQRKDAVAVPWMAKFTRNPLPEKIVWKQDDVTHGQFYWLAVDVKTIKGRATIVATRDGQNVKITADGADAVTVLLDDRMLDLDKPVAISLGGKSVFRGRVHRNIAALAMSLAERGDRELMFAAQVAVSKQAMP